MVGEKATARYEWDKISTLRLLGQTQKKEEKKRRDRRGEERGGEEMRERGEERVGV